MRRFETGMGRKLLHLLNGLITCAVTIALLAAGAYAGYALWDNQQIYDAAENVYSEMKEIKEAMGMPATRSAMEELLEENRKAKEAKAAETEKAAETPPVPELPAVSVEPAAPEELTAADTSAAEEPAVTEIPVAAEVREETETTGAGFNSETVMPAAETAADTEQPAAVPATPAPTTTPAPTAEPIDPLLAQLRTINPDITAWLTLPDTAIDYPVMQGASNYSYINTDVYGNFALAGSIFLDYRNDKDYTNLYSLLYGHNMSEHRMFSDINLYKEEEFFKENTLGMMLTEDGWHILESVAVIVTPASNSGLFNPENWNNSDKEDFYRMAQDDALFTCEDGLKALREQIDDDETTPRLIALSTCSDEFTDARTILLTLMDP